MDANLHTIEGAYSYIYKGYYFAWLGNIWFAYMYFSDHKVPYF
jgi:hypothetical protein